MFSFVRKVFVQTAGFLHDTIGAFSDAGRTARQAAAQERRKARM